jgi:undecaprenyl-diphosphatase
MKKFLKSFLVSFENAFAENEYIIRLGQKYPRSVRFLLNRVSASGAYGIWFTVASILSLWFISNFLSLVVDVLRAYPFITTDVRMMNLFVEGRSDDATSILLFVTHLIDPAVFISLALLVIYILWVYRAKREILFFSFALVIGEIMSFITKHFVGRQRPEDGYSLIIEDGYSFPSGHATLSMIFFGLIAFGLFIFLKRRWSKLLVLFTTFIAVFLIGISRLYLGVHWSSDVLAGWNIGAVVVLMAAALYSENSFIPGFGYAKYERPRSRWFYLIFILVIFEGFFIYKYDQNHPLREPVSIQQPSPVVIAPTEDITQYILSPAFPKYSETVVGESMEPVSFIVVGQKDQLVKAFMDAGWYTADPIGFVSTWDMFYAAVTGTQYLNAPVTPTFLKSTPEEIAFQKPTETNIFKQRHHTRYWETNYFVGGNPVWVATASLDDGYRYYITHKIRPEIDVERDFIKDDLVNTGGVQELKMIQLVKSFLGKNQAGDPFFTDGKAYIIYLK